MTTLYKGILDVARISAPADPAFATRDARWLDAVKRYVRTRAPEDLAKLPLREGRTPVLFGVDVLTPAQHDEATRLKDLAHFQACARLGVKTIRFPDGKTETAPRDGKTESGDAWLARLYAVAGARGVLELGQTVRLRTEIGDVTADEIEGDEDPLGRSDLYSLPSGAPLAVHRAPASAAGAPSSTSSETIPE